MAQSYLYTLPHIGNTGNTRVYLLSSILDFHHYILSISFIYQLAHKTSTKMGKMAEVQRRLLEVSH
jgi:hypothetical protein